MNAPTVNASDLKWLGVGNDPHCHYCGAATRKKQGRTPHEQELERTRDHINPQCQGGGPTVTACKRCNVVKAEHSYAEFKLFADLLLRGQQPRSTAKEAAFAFKAWRLGRLF